MLRVRLLGALEVEREGAIVDSPGSQRPWAMLGFIALSGRAVTRAELAGRFWPDVLDQSARASVRSALWTLRRSLGDALVVDGDRIALGPEGSVWVDVHEFERLAGRDPEQALALCRGELLEGVELEWAILARQRHRERVVELLERLASAAQAADQLDAAIAFTRRQVDLDPLDEPAHRRLMARLAAGGDPAAALRTYRALSDRLRRELAVAPSPVTRELATRLQAPAIAAPPPLPRSVAAGTLPLIGRAAELAELEHAWAAVTAHRRGAVAVLRGEAGIGKTRLTAELQRLAAGAGGRVASGAGLDLGGLAPFSLWAEVVRELVRTLPAPLEPPSWAADVAVLAGGLPEPFRVTEPPAARIAPDLLRVRLFEAVVGLIGWAADLAPVLIALEDVHGADSASLELAGYVARRLPSLPVMLVLTRRELPHNADVDRLEHALRARGLLACEIELGPLPARELAELTRRAAALGTADVERVVSLADGNPLLALESARALARGGAGITPTVRGATRAALATVSARARELVEVLAVAARPVEPRELRALVRPGEDDPAGEALETGLLLAGDVRVGFRHALLRDAVYEEIAVPRRAALHHRWAQALQATSGGEVAADPAEVARHLRLAHADAEAVPLLVRAAGAARTFGALAEAVAYLEEALGIAPERSHMWLELGELEAWRVRRPEAERAFDRGLALLEDAPAIDRARAWLRRARAYHGPICMPRAVRESAQAAVALLEELDPPPAVELSEALAAAAWAEAVAGSVERADELLTEVSALGEARGDLGIYDAGHARALALMRRGRFGDSYGPSIAAGEAIARAARPDLAYGCWANVASAANAAGEPERALEFLDRGMAALAGRGLQGLEVHLLAARSFVLRGTGRLAEARAAAQAEHRLAEQLGQPELEAMSLHDLGEVALANGEYTEAAELLAGSLVEGAPISRPHTRLALAEALTRAGELERATDELRATVLEPVGPGDFPAALVPALTRVQALVAQARGDADEARRRFQEAIAGWERLLPSAIRAESMTSVLADLGRPVVGLVEPERELARVRAELASLTPREGSTIDAVVP